MMDAVMHVMTRAHRVSLTFATQPLHKPLSFLTPVAAVTSFLRVDSQKFRVELFREPLVWRHLRPTRR
jgi:hypothetical protein